MGKRVFADHFEKALHKLIAYYEHADIAKHGGLKGMAREGFIKCFLKDNLPSLLEYSTGEIIDKHDNRSGQIDIILSSAFSPIIKLFDDINITINDFTLGAIEVKSKLTTANWESDSSLKDALELSKKVKALERDLKISSHMEWMTEEDPNMIIDRTPFFLVAYDGPEIETLFDKMVDYGSYRGLTLNEYFPEVTLVINRRYTIIKNDGFLYNLDGQQFIKYEGEECLVDLYMYIFTLISAFADPHKRTGTFSPGLYFQ
jgi:hypothetical protein